MLRRPQPGPGPVRRSAALALLTLVFALPDAASAEVSCSYNEEGELGPQGNVLRVHITDDDETATIARAGDAIEVQEDDYFFSSASGPLACAGGPATVTNTDAVQVLAATPAIDSSGVTVDLGGGDFAPGATDEGDGTSEIEITASLLGDGDFVFLLGGAGEDAIRLGSTGTGLGANLNAGDEGAPDVDLEVQESNGIGVSGGGGDDVLDASGGPEFSSELQGEQIISFIYGGGGDDILGGTSQADFLSGSGGRDRLSAGRGNDYTVGGSGRDRLRAGGGKDDLESRDGEVDVVGCGPGDDFLSADVLDRIKSCEQARTR